MSIKHDYADADARTDFVVRYFNESDDWREEPVEKGELDKRYLSADGLCKVSIARWRNECLDDFLTFTSTDKANKKGVACVQTDFRMDAYNTLGDIVKRSAEMAVRGFDESDLHDVLLKHGFAWRLSSNNRTLLVYRPHLEGELIVREKNGFIVAPSGEAFEYDKEGLKRLIDELMFELIFQDTFSMVFNLCQDYGRIEYANTRIRVLAWETCDLTIFLRLPFGEKAIINCLAPEKTRRWPRIHVCVDDATGLTKLTREMDFTNAAMYSDIVRLFDEAFARK